MDKTMLKKAFLDRGLRITFASMSDADILTKAKEKIVIYTSQEDSGYLYKNFIEDVVLNLEMSGISVIPPYKYLRANNNKVFMEMLRKSMLPDKYQLETRWFGTAEEAMENITNMRFPVVIKTAAGASSRGVRLAKSVDDYVARVKELSRSLYMKDEMIDYLRRIRNRGYVGDSIFRKKIIVQEFVPGLVNDWKVLVFCDKYYVLKRSNRKSDFRASGSGIFSFEDKVDPFLLEGAKDISSLFNVPIVSLDLAVSSGRIVLIEAQFIYFGTRTLEQSPYYYTYCDSIWHQVNKESILERVYANAIADYIDEKL
ncbi:MAG: hypothetical protein PHC39_07960 [Proteiniphilum sp.]|nr:hypothetical protein [Proteiniphilum sp.]